MINLKKISELSSWVLSSVGRKEVELKNSKTAYTEIRNQVLGEDLFFETSAQKVYDCLRNYDNVANTYIRNLEKRLNELESQKTMSINEL